MVTQTPRKDLPDLIIKVVVITSIQVQCYPVS